MMPESPNLVVVLGPTACGKTRLAVTLARELNSCVISADSRQVYQGMDIGTGKDLAEYGDVPVHLLDMVDPMTEFNVFTYQHAFNDVFTACRAADEIPVLCGGSGLYLEAVLAGYRFGRNQPPQSNDALNAMLREEDSFKALSIKITPLIFGIRWPRPVLRKRITARLKERLDGGMLDEVRTLLAQGVSYERLEALGLEYRWAALYLQDNLRYNDFFQRLNSAIHQFAKRQDTWFRKMERNGFEIEWLDGGETMTDEALTKMRAKIAQND